MDIVLLNKRLESLEAEAILKWGLETFRPKVAVSSSFQTQSVPLLHLISRICPDMPIIFIDTGYHFPETLKFRDNLQNRLGLNIFVYRPSTENRRPLFDDHSGALYRRDPDLCCYINKVEPMQRVVAELGLEALISGVRRDQTEYRKGLRVLERQQTGLLRIHPLINWVRSDVFAYIENNGLPKHPLYEWGYTSVGCAPCTRPVRPGEEERTGRWAGTEKKECGLHLNLTEVRNSGEKREKH